MSATKSDIAQAATASTLAAHDPSSGYGRLRRLTLAPEFGAAVTVLVLYTFFAVLSHGNGFVTWPATASWLNVASLLGIIAVPVGLLMIAGNFDLSIGSMVGAGAITVGICMNHFHLTLMPSAGIALLLGVIVGLGNGILVTQTGLPSFIVTLAANLIVAGLALTISLALTQSTVIGITTGGVPAKIFSGTWHQFNITILWWFVILTLAVWLLGQTQFGNWIFATGGDSIKARRSGVLTSHVTITLYILSATAAALVGIMEAVQYNTADATTGQGFVFEAPIVVVIGGVLLTGGYGSMIGVFLGTLIYGIVDAGLFYTGWNTDWAQVVIGTLMVIAVVTNNFVRHLALSAIRRDSDR